MAQVFGTRKVLEEIRDLRGETGEIPTILAEIRDLKGEIRGLHAENVETINFTREMLRRNEVAFQDFRTELRESRVKQNEELAETRAETRAQTRGLYALIDRLENGGGAAPAT